MSEQRTSSGRRVAIIGAGVAGIATAKCLMDDGHDPVVFERTDKIGGIWVYEQGREGGVYATTVYQNTKYVSCFSDFPMGDAVSVFPRHDEILDYLAAYAGHFGVVARIELSTEVISAIQEPDQSWRVRVRGPAGERTERFDAIAVCTGTYGRPQYPQVAGLDTFTGSVHHSAHYRTNDALRGRRVVVVGGGVSGMDIAVDVCKVARQTTWSVRSRHWIRPRWFGFVPYEAGVVKTANPTREEMLAHWRQWIPDLYAKMEQTGWIPEKNPFAEGFGASDEILDCLVEGRVRERAAVSKINGSSVSFEDGTEVDADAIVFATGYQGYSFPFFDHALQRTLGVHEEGIDLYREVFHPRVPACAFMFHASGNAPAMPTVELQARWFSLVLSGHRSLPASGEMEQWLQRDRAWRRQHYNETSYRANFIDGRYVRELAEYIGVLPDKRTQWNDYFELVKPPSFPHIFRVHGPGRQEQAWDLIRQARAAYPVKSDKGPEVRRQILEQLPHGDLLAMYCGGQIDRQDIVGALTGESPQAVASAVRSAPVAPQLAERASPLPVPHDAKALAVQLRGLAAAILEYDESEISLTGRFADYGFDSLTMVQFSSQIKARYGVQLQPADFFQHPTPSALASHLANAQRARQPAVQQPVFAAPKNGVLLPLKDAGEGQALFLIHPVGGSPFCYVPLARALDDLRPEQRLYGVQSVGLFGVDEPLETVQDMARQYAAELIHVQPKGSFQIGGWSFGGVLAFEVAAQLEAQGRGVASVLLVDSYSHAGNKSYLAGHDRASLLRVYMETLARQKGQAFAAPRTDADFATLLRYGFDNGLFPASMDEAAVDRLLDVYRLNIAAFEGYRPARVRAPVSALVCTDQSAIGSEEQALAWAQRTQGPFDMRSIEGDHYSIMAAQRVRELCTWMLDRLSHTASAKRQLVA